jgi:hypothetical protein
VGKWRNFDGLKGLVGQGLLMLFVGKSWRTKEKLKAVDGQGLF